MSGYGNPQQGYGPPQGHYGQPQQGYGQPQFDYGQAQAGHQQAQHNSREVGIFKPFMAHNGSTIVLKEHVLSLTGDSFSVKLADGTPILQVEGKLLSISGRKKVSDMAGNHLFDIVKEHFHIHTTYAAEDPQGNKLMEVKSSFKCKKSGANSFTSANTRYYYVVLGSKATATFKNASGIDHELKMKGSIFDTSAEIIDSTRSGMISFGHGRLRYTNTMSRCGCCSY